LFVVSASVVGANIVVATGCTVGGHSGFARLTLYSGSISGSVVNTEFSVDASLDVVLATFGSVASIDCAAVVVVAVNRSVDASSVEARVRCARVEVIAVNVSDGTSLSNDTSLRLAKIRCGASLVCACSV